MWVEMNFFRDEKKIKEIISDILLWKNYLFVSKSEEFKKVTFNKLKKVLLSNEKERILIYAYEKWFVYKLFNLNWKIVLEERCKFDKFDEKDKIIRNDEVYD